MNDNNGETQDHVPLPGPKSQPTPPADDDKQGAVDFDTYPSVGPGGATRQAHVSEPVSGGSVISWAELLKHQPRPASEDEVLLGSLPELQIDAESDHEIIKSLQKEAGKSGYLRKLSGQSSKLPKSSSQAKPDNGTPPAKPERPAAKDRPAPEQVPLAAKVFSGKKKSDAEIWLRGPTGGESTIDLATAAQDAAAGATGPGSGDRKDESSDVLAAAIHPDDGTSAVNLGDEPRNSAINSWNSGAPVPSLVPPAMRPTPPARHPTTSRRPRTLSAWLGGAAIGVAASALLGTGLWFGGALSRDHGTRNSQTTSAGVAAAKPTPEQARHHLEAGDLDLALETFGRCDESPSALAGRGEARWLAYLRQQKRQRVALAENDAEVVAARKELVDSKSAEGTLWLGLINEAFGRTDEARETYDSGRDNFPHRARLFIAARSRLDAMAGGKKVAVKIDPQLGLALALTMMELPPDAGGLTDEAGYDFWDAVALSRKGDFSGARAALLKARAAHEQRRDLFIRRGPNPDSDPRDDIFLHSCDQMLAWWDVQAKLQSAGFGGQSPGQTVDALLANQKKYDEAMKALVTTLKVEKVDEIAEAIDGVIKQRQQAIDKWKQADEAARRAEDSLKTAQRDLGKKDNELAAARKTAATELKQALAQEAEARKALEEAAAARRKADESYRGVQARLVKAKLVGEQSEPADVVRALDTLLSTDVIEKDAEIARLRSLLEQSKHMPNVPTPAPATDPDLAEKLFSSGLQLYYAGKHADAEEQLAAAALQNARDARILYFLGLTRVAQGKTDAADADFRRAVELERRKLPESSEVSAALERIQGPDRQIINRYRR
jgi:tetratricopeptide (TPR) repeat protein